jgi:hypothetical protein
LPLQLPGDAMDARAGLRNIGQGRSSGMGSGAANSWKLLRLPEAMTIRRQTVEHPFGMLKAWTFCLIRRKADISSPRPARGL